MVSYDNQTRECRFDPTWFKNASTEAVSRVIWKSFAKKGKKVAPGTLLGTVVWNDGSRAKLKAPTGCRGTIEATNRRIEYDRLHKKPAQSAFRLM